MLRNQFASAAIKLRLKLSRMNGINKKMEDQKGPQIGQDGASAIAIPHTQEILGQLFC